MDAHDAPVDAHDVTLDLCSFEDLIEDSCFFCAISEQSMMVFRKCDDQLAYCLDDGGTYRFHPDVPVSPQFVH